ncbi:MAG: zinc-binding dehydrogenase [Actinomycetota bacterium]|nr:zinc-binding dehydrogenase [Actinomycetota bacterium]
MKALTFEYSIPKYLLTGALARGWRDVLHTSMAPVQMRDIPEPVLPAPDWVKIRPLLAGLCGSDLSIIACRENLTLQPFASFPFVLGHEVCGEIVEKGADVEGFEIGERVTVMPMLGCIPRRIDPPCRMCAEGRYALCGNFITGSLKPGMFVGNTAGIPGFISEMGVAHSSQLYRVPDEVDDACAVLTEPLSTGLHMVFDNPFRESETVMVIGCGVMGLCTIISIRALHPECRILAVEIDSFHSEIAMEMGADEVIKPGGKAFYRKVAELTGAKMHTPLLAKPLLTGGVDRVFDAVGSTETLEASLRILANGGWYNQLGIGEIGKIDWTPVWLKEITIRGIYGYHGRYDGERGFNSFETALRLFQEGKIDLSSMVTHRFSLEQWPEALDVALNKGHNSAIKIAFTP